MNELTILKPDDWHLHFRDGDLLQETVPATARCFARAIVMPNLVPPVTNAEMALNYKKRILAASPTPAAETEPFSPLMTIYLTNTTSVEDIKSAKQAGITAAKFYPAGATTNSDAAVSQIDSLYPIFEAMAKHSLPLLIHGEVTDNDIDIFDREAIFIDRNLTKLARNFPELKIVLEHITTREAVDFINESRHFFS